MSSYYSKQTKNGKQFGRSLYPWHFDKFEIVLSTPSRDHGIQYEEELILRQNACKFLHEMVHNLTFSKGDHLATGVASVFINRFFKFHSFKTFDYRDIAAACLFLSGKNEDSPRKLKYIVTQWWHLKFPHHTTFNSERQFLDACDLIVQLESVVLMTLAFDMNVDLPHQYVLKIMQQIERGRCNYKEMVKTAYYLATDILMVTDWSIRYSCTYIAMACINIAAFFHDVNMLEVAPAEMANRWFRLEDPDMSMEILDEMTNEFLHIFAKRPDMHIGSLRRIDPKGKVKLVTQKSPEHVSSSVLPPPPAAPILAPKKVDLTTYKERQKSTIASATTTTDSPRQSFLPDVQNIAEVKRELAKSQAQHSHHNHHQHQHQHSRPHFSSHHSEEKSKIPVEQRPSTSSLKEGHRERSSSGSMKNGIRQNHHSHSHHHYNHNHNNSHGHHSNGVNNVQISTLENHRKEYNEKEHNHRINEDNNRNKRPQIDIKNEYQFKEKRTKLDSSGNFSMESASVNYKFHNKSNGSMIMNSLMKHDILTKPTSEYSKKCLSLEKNKNTFTKSMDPSPPTFSPPFLHSNVPPSQPFVFTNDEMEDGEVR